MSSKAMLNNQDFIQQKYSELVKALPPVRVRNYRENSWNLIQQRIYTTFLRENIGTIRTLHQRKCFRPFKKIARLVKTRTPVQVKSHHQKLIQKFKDLETVIIKMEEYLQSMEEKNESHTEQQESIQNLFEGIVFERFKPCIKVTPYDTSLKLQSQFDYNLIIFEQNDEKMVYRIDQDPSQ